MCSDMLHISKNLKNTLAKMLNENHFKQRNYSTFKNIGTLVVLFRLRKEHVNIPF
jgi:hypothetical protein